MDRHDKMLLAAAVSAALLAGTAQAQNAAGVDTSDWKCEDCPFQQDYEAVAKAGVKYVDEDSAKFGEYNGLDRKGAHLDLNARGGSRTGKGTYYRYDLKDLGLDTREAKLVVGREGVIEGTLYYDGIPHRVWDSALTPYSRSGRDTLVLPADWVAASSTGGMTSLAGALSSMRIGTERKTLGAGLAYLVGSNVKFNAKYSHQEIEGDKIGSANFLFHALQYPEPVKAAHDQVDLDATYRWKTGYARLSWYGSSYDNSVSALTFDNPYVPAAPDSALGRKAGAPDNKAQTFALDGNFLLPVMDGVLSYRLARGSMDQTADFLPFSTSDVLNATATLPRQNLNADVSISHYRATLALRPAARVRARFGYSYDERDDGTKPLTTYWVESDSAVNGPDTALGYSYKRTRFDGFVEGNLAEWLHLGAGGDSDTMDRSNQETNHTRDNRGYLQLRMHGFGSVEVNAKYGRADHTAGNYTTISGPWPENPLLRKYNQADRSSDFAEMRVGWAPWKLAIALEGSYSFDDYRHSVYGLTSGRDYRYAGTVTLPVAEKASVYVSGSYQNIATEQAGEQVFTNSALPWAVSHEDEFKTAGAGITWKKLAGKFNVTLDYTYATSDGAITSAISYPPSASGSFPALKSELNSVRLSASYKVNDRLNVGAAWAWEDYTSSNWQIAGLAPATLPGLLSMGVNPYKYTVNVIGVSFSYRVGKTVMDYE